MIRLLGAALLCGGSTALGLAAVGRMEARARDLRGLVAGLEVMERELGWRLAPLPELLNGAADGVNGAPRRFFLLCAQETGRLGGRPFQEVWRWSQGSSGLRLTGADRLPLEQLGTVLGRYDAQAQRRALREAAARLEGQRVQAQARREQLGRVYGALGVTAGALLAILLI